jgi:GTPase involved in cell partitioning and DNA repair
VKAIDLLEAELKKYDPDLCRKGRIIIGSKTDLDESGGKMAALVAAFPGECITGISVFTRDGLEKIEDLFIERGSGIR